MKDFTKKAFIVFLFAVSFMFMFGTIIKVGDDNYTINEYEPVNYNGYFNKVDEDKFIELGFVYIDDDIEYGSYYLVDYSIQVNFNIGLTREYLMYEANYYVNNNYFYGAYISYQFASNLQSVNIFGVNGMVLEVVNVDDFLLRIIGISNYEVIS